MSYKETVIAVIIIAIFDFSFMFGVFSFAPTETVDTTQSVNYENSYISGVVGATNNDDTAAEPEQLEEEYVAAEENMSQGADISFEDVFIEPIKRNIVGDFYSDNDRFYHFYDDYTFSGYIDETMPYATGFVYDIYSIDNETYLRFVGNGIEKILKINSAEQDFVILETEDNSIITLYRAR